MNYLIKQNSSTAGFASKLLDKLTVHSGITLSLMGAAVLTLSGCATTQSLTPQQCQESNWQEVGYADGLRGRSGAYFGHYANSCASVGGATPNRMQWEQGRQQGLKITVLSLMLISLDAKVTIGNLFVPLKVSRS